MKKFFVLIIGILFLGAGCLVSVFAKNISGTHE
jgi:hypothetical protein